MRIEDELLTAAKAAEELSSLLTRAANEIRQLRNDLQDAKRVQLNAAMRATHGPQEPPESPPSA